MATAQLSSSSSSRFTGGTDRGNWRPRAAQPAASRADASRADASRAGGAAAAPFRRGRSGTDAPATRPNNGARFAGDRSSPVAGGSERPSGSREPGQRRRSRAQGPRPDAEHEILFQKFFKSVGPRTYAVQVKRATNGNHFIVLMEGKRDEKTAEVRKTRLFIFSEDFPEFFRMLKGLADFVKDHPVPKEVQEQRQKFWNKQANGKGSPPRRDAAREVAAKPA